MMTSKHVGSVMARVALVGALALAQLFISAVAAPSAHADAWRLAWNDEFNGTQLDQSKWQAITGDGAAWYGSNYYLAGDVSEGNGALTVLSERRSFGPRAYTSGGVSSRGRFAFTYGLVEWRAWVPGGAGVWPALWLMPEDGSWPPEIDAMENMGTTDKVAMTYHWQQGSDGQSSVTTTVPNLTSGYHTFAVRWVPGEIDWLIDGLPARAPYIGANVPSTPMFLYMNTAVCDGCQTCNWCGRPALNRFPQAMRIDYVRVYRDTPDGANLGNRPGSNAISGWLGRGAVTRNLTWEGTDDWIVWGSRSAADVDRKAGVRPQIGTYGLVGGSAMLSGGGGSTLIWSDGTPLRAGVNPTLGAVVCGGGSGFTFAVPANATPRTLNVYVTVYKATGRFTASLSGTSQPGYADASLSDPVSSSAGVFHVRFSSTAGQTLTLVWTTGTDYGGGCVVLEGATLQG